MRVLILLLIFCFLSPAWSDIQFEEVSQQAGIDRIGESWGNAWGDFDGDGYLDLWATNHRHKPSLYRNNGDGTFTDIIDEVWDANPLADTHGVAWADYDNDGDQDLIVLSGSGGGLGGVRNNHANHFYVNENGLLIERAAELGVDYPLLRGRTPLWLDVNRDGRLDLLLTGTTRYSAGALITSALFGQTMNGFEDISTVTGFSFQESAALAQYADITSDGSMEIVVSYHNYPLAIYDTSGSPFKDLIGTLGIPRGYSVHDAAIADFNGDLHLDIFLARGLYQSSAGQVDPYKLELNIRTSGVNEKGVRFKTEGDVSFQIYSEWGPRLPLVNIGAEGHWVTAFEGGEFQGVTPNLRSATFEVTLSPNDPRVAGLKPRPEDANYGIYVGYQPDTKTWTLLCQEKPAIILVKATQPISELETINFSIGDLRGQPPSQLFINQGDGFQNTGSVGALNTFEDGRCVAAGDFDNDMDIDLYVVRSRTSANVPNRLYTNVGNGLFLTSLDTDSVSGSPNGRGQSATVADYDRDGYLDLFVTNGRAEYPFSEGPDQLFRNIGGNNNYLQIDLEGTVSNRDGIGARLFVTTPDGKTQLRENGGGIHWAQQDQKRIHFGLAQNEKVSELAIHWPSGIIQKLTDVPVNQILRVVEPNERPYLTGDVNQDEQVDILDFLLILVHFGEKPPTNPRTDVNKDGEINISDLAWLVNFIEEKRAAAAAPYRKHITGATYRDILDSTRQLSKTDTALLNSFYEKIEGISGNAAQIELVKRFLRQLLMPVEEPLVTKLHANFPNPFNPETWIPYQLATDGDITIRIYNTSGHVVRTLFAGHQGAGYYLNRSKAAYWDGRNEIGEQVASGVYIYELVTPTFKQTRRLVILK
ncbi:MAG: FG-GAP-like repeat-containing protein [Candidatus Poribacteria bacterium]|nr:FG-GAP-like repeat-containing protein [Candidatus Poribacteria bacterium]